MRIRTRLVVVFFSSLIALAGPAHAQTSPAPQPSDQQIYETYRAWVTRQPPGDRPAALERYRQVLAAEGTAPAEIDRRIRVITTEGKRLEIEMWNRVLTAEKPVFNTEPNAFLVRMAQGRKPGRALDVGMGQGRNALYLATQGWNVTGFDPAEKAVAAAQEQAKRMGLTMTTRVEGDETFDFGREQWDLILLSYVSLRHLGSRVYDGLRPGGLVVIEGFHRDATKTASIGGGVVFDSNELLKLFERYRIVHYEDVDAVGDFGQQPTRVVRLAAQKP